ncbi:MAG: hypothetical protein PVH30_02310 [Desulfobacterales bacterium]|jgi:acetate kinase
MCIDTERYTVPDQDIREIQHHSRVRIRVVPTDEEKEIALQDLRLVPSSS